MLEKGDGPVGGPESDEDGRDVAGEAFVEVSGLDDRGGRRGGNDDEVGAGVPDLLGHFGGEVVDGEDFGVVSDEVEQAREHVAGDLIRLVAGGENQDAGMNVTGKPGWRGIGSGELDEPGGGVGRGG